MGRADTHTRLVGWLKILLPLLALAILSTLFLVARTVDPTAALPYATVDVEARVREPRMTAPEYSGTTSDGGALTLTASEVRPLEGGNTRARTVRATLETADGATTRLTAATAQMDATAQLLHLSGGVQADTSTGYRIEAQAMVAELDRSALRSAGAVVATGPPGRLTAQSMAIEADPAARGGYLLVFKTSVKLIYQPGN